MSSDDAINSVMALAFGYAASRQAALNESGGKLAHYTTAETALRILDGRKLWMRNATVMNDHSELQHGHEIVSDALNMNAGNRLKGVLCQINPELFQMVSPLLGRFSEVERSRIFMTSLSEHQPDDRLGRLSMWRAYGGSIAGAALVFNSEVFESQHDQLGTIASPVLYGGLDEFLVEFNSFLDRLERSVDLIRSVPLNNSSSIIRAALQYAFMSLKHVGFKEEQEWRLIHRPFHGEGSAWVHDKILAVNGVPQLIYELPLGNIHDGMNMPDLELDQLLYSVIIGPSVHPETVQRAFIDKLKSLGVSNAEAKVVVSEIPLRH